MATTNYNTALNTQTYEAEQAAPPTGLINTPATGTASLQQPAAQATAAEWQVQPNQTVQGQVKDIIADNSPLMQQAETRALQKANSRGLMNSSIAVGAGQSAVFDAATPIAAADAATYARSGEFNAGAKQQVGLANTAATNAVNSQNSQLETNVSLNNAQSANDMAKAKASIDADISKFNASQSNDLLKLGMDAQTKTELANIEASYKQLMQTSASAADLYKQYMQSAQTILMSKDMDAASKSQAIKNAIAGLNNGLAIQGQINNLNLTDLLTFSTPGA